VEDITQNPINDSADLLKSLAAEHQVPLEIAEQMIVLMQKYPDLSIWGSKPELMSQLEKVLKSALDNKLIGME